MEGYDSAMLRIIAADIIRLGRSMILVRCLDADLVTIPSSFLPKRSANLAGHLIGFGVPGKT